MKTRGFGALNGLRGLLLLILLIGGCAHEGPGPVSGSNPDAARSHEGRIVSLSDLHFDPFYDPAIVPALLQSPASEWRKIFESSQVAGYGAFGHDSNFPLLLSALRYAGQVARRPDFVVISGDFLAHRFNKTYYHYAGNQDPQGLQAFIDKTVTFVTGLVQEHLPDTPIYPALGNEDSYCGDYRIDPKGAFLGRTADTWRKLIRDGKNERAFMATFPIGGYYAVQPPHSSKRRMIVLNTVFLSMEYQDQCGDPKEKPGEDELRWLGDQLKQAAAEGEKVWLVYHIPPGIDAYSTAKFSGGTKKGMVVTFWQPPYTQRVLSLLDQYRDTIILSLAGHTHMDDFRLTPSGPGAQVPPFLLITPAVSPIFGNNPGMHLLTYDRQTFSLQDWATHRLSLTAGADAAWKEEYRFSQAYGLSPVEGVTLAMLSARLKTDSHQSRATYIRYYNVDHTADPPITDETWPIYWCAIGNPTAAAFQTCVADPGQAVKP